MGIIKFIVITILVLYIIRVIIRLILPMVFVKMVNKVQQKAQGQAGQQPRERNSKPEGSISIDYMPPQAKGGRTDKLGDFVDYEEIK